MELGDGTVDLYLLASSDAVQQGKCPGCRILADRIKILGRYGHILQRDTAGGRAVGHLHRFVVDQRAIDHLVPHVKTEVGDVGRQTMQGSGRHAGRDPQRLLECPQSGGRYRGVYGSPRQTDKAEAPQRRALDRELGLDVATTAGNDAQPAVNIKIKRQGLFRSGNRGISH